VLVAGTGVSAAFIFQMLTSMVLWRKVAKGLKKNGVIFGIKKARRDAKALMSGVVGSANETTRASGSGRHGDDKLLTKGFTLVKGSGLR